MSRTMRSKYATSKRIGNARKVVRRKKLIDRRAERKRRNTQTMKELNERSNRTALS